jgi:leucine dehydrogenase
MLRWIAPKNMEVPRALPVGLPSTLARKGARMPKIRDDLTLEQLKRVMDFAIEGIPAHENIVAAVHSLLQRPENIFYRDIGHGRAIWVARNNTIICARSPKPMAWYLGGCRWKGYSGEREATIDVRNLAKGMSYKWAILNLMFSKMALEGRAEIEEVRASRIGGGKSVIYEPHYETQNFSRAGQPLSDLEREILRDKVVPVVLGLVQYVFAPDMGTRCEHVDFVGAYAPHNVACLCLENDGSGDPSLITARGVYESMMESVIYQFGKEGFDGKTIAVQGLGKVGALLIEDIIRDYPDTRLIITDTDSRKVTEMLGVLKAKGINVMSVEPNEIYDQKFDIFSPNAIGQTINPPTVRRMVRANKGKKLIIVGAANNQIDDRRKGSRREVEGALKEFNILYAPDFVVNLGGILNLVYEFDMVRSRFGGKYDQKRPLEVIHGVRAILREIYERSRRLGVSPQLVADRLAEEQIARWALFSRFDSDQLLDRRYLVDLLPTGSGNARIS